MKASAMATVLAAALAGARDDNADVVEGRSDRRMRLAHSDANAANLRIVGEHRLGDSASGSLDQPIAARTERFTRGLHQRLIRHRRLQLIGAGGFAEIDVENEIEPKRLPDLSLVRHHAV